MIFKTLKGRRKDISLKRYLIDWEPVREVSKPQAQVKAFLRQFWRHKMVCEEVPVAGTRLRLDLFCVTDSLVVEVSPASTHSIYNPFMHGSLSGYCKTIKRDLQKVAWCEINGLTLITLIDEDIADLSVERFKNNFGVEL